MRLTEYQINFSTPSAISRYRTGMFSLNEMESISEEFEISIQKFGGGQSA